MSLRAKRSNLLTRRGLLRFARNDKGRVEFFLCKWIVLCLVNILGFFFCYIIQANIFCIIFFAVYTIKGVIELVRSLNRPKISRLDKFSVSFLNAIAELPYFGGTI